MAVTKEEVKNLADLVRMDIAPEELEKITSDIGSILEYVGTVQKFSGDSERKVSSLRNVMREDIPTNNPNEYKDDLLKNAPKRDGDYLVVKKIL
ncbi:MAG: Asp-tRNA(Asn)/Glu-tRNA(Gln) amidotransferase subunit GatC [Minisyncoccia bacterium]